MQVSDGSSVSLVESELAANSVGIIVERDGQLAVTNASFEDNDLAALLAGQVPQKSPTKLNQTKLN